MAEELAMPENSVKSAIHRLRRRYGELIREEVAHTVEAPPLIDEEIRYLLSVVSDGWPVQLWRQDSHVML